MTKLVETIKKVFSWACRTEMKEKVGGKQKRILLKMWRFIIYLHKYKQK